MITHTAIRWQGMLFVSALLLFSVLLAWISARYSVQFDMTAQARHSLTAGSVKVVQSLDGPLRIDAWFEKNPQLRIALKRIIARYQTHKADIALHFIDPVTAPAQARNNNIHAGGELILSWQGHEQRLRSISEKSLSYAMLRLARKAAPVVRFVSGHLERQPDSASRHGYQQFIQHLRTLGFNVQTLSLVSTPVVPVDTDVLVIAAPAGGYFPGEAASVLNYLSRGGNLLWLLEPGLPSAPVELAAELGLSVLPGVIVDVASQQLAVDTPDFAVIDHYPIHPALPERLPTSLFPQAVGLSFPTMFGWQLQPLLLTSEKSWSEVGQIAGKIRYNPGTAEQAGPIVLGATLQRTRGQQEQRVAVIGDADFLANNWLGNGGNLYLGQQLFNWLGSQQPLPAIAPVQAADAQLILSKLTIGLLGFGFLVVLPVGYLLLAFLYWRRGR